MARGCGARPGAGRRYGGGTTSIGVFERGHLTHVDAVAVGGHHVTMDIARGLTMRLADALKGAGPAS